jgi:hypothetical protein
MLRPICFALLATPLLYGGCAKKIEPTAAMPALPDAVQVTTVTTVATTQRDGDEAVMLQTPASTQPFPAVLMAVDVKVAEMELTGNYANGGQVWLITDSNTAARFRGSAHSVTDKIGAAAFERDGPADPGSWAIGCTSFRADNIAVAAQHSEHGEIYPIAEVVPDTLQRVATEAAAVELLPGYACE